MPLGLLCCVTHGSIFFFFNDTATTEIYTLSLHDALPISPTPRPSRASATAGTSRSTGFARTPAPRPRAPAGRCRSEEHTSELQSRQYLVCRLLLEKKKNTRMKSSNSNI